LMLLSASVLFFLIYCYVPHRSLRSFPTRRSSDLLERHLPGQHRGGGGRLQADRRGGAAVGLPRRHARAPGGGGPSGLAGLRRGRDRKSTRLNSSHVKISYAVFCLKKKTCINVTGR